MRRNGRAHRTPDLTDEQRQHKVNVLALSLLEDGMTGTEVSSHLKKLQFDYDTAARALAWALEEVNRRHGQPPLPLA